MLVRRLSVAGALVLLVVLGSAGSARACSCAPASPGESLRESDAAMVGRLVEVVPRGAVQAEYRYEVVRVYRGAKTIERGQMLAVRSARRAAACALPRREEQRYGLFLSRSGGKWRSGICAVVSPRELWAAARHPGKRAGRSGPPSSGCPA